MNTLLHMSGRQKVTVMIAVMLGMFLAALDQTIVATALPRIVSDFNALGHLSWVLTAYMLTSTIVVPIYGRLSDLYGRKGFFLASIVIFLVGSALCGAAQDMTQLIIFRALQGIGGGAIMTNAFAIVGDLFTPVERGKWQGIMGGVFGLSSVVGPLLGGWMTDHLSWRWNFYINMPLGVLAMLGIFLWLPKIVHPAKEKSIDIFGSIYLAMGLTALLLALVWGGNTYPWGSEEVVLMFGFAFLALSFFFSIEKMVKMPVLPLDLFKEPVFSVSILMTFFLGMGMFGVISYIPFFAQKVMQITATNSGTLLSPMMVGLICASILSGQILSRTGRYKALAVLGMIISPIAMFSLSTMDADTSSWGLAARMIGVGAGIGFSMPILNIAVQNAFDRSRIGVVTASVQLFRSIGGTVGVTLMGAVFNDGMTRYNGDMAHALQNVFLLSTGVMLVGMLISFFLKELPMRSPEKSHGLEEAGKELAVEEGNAMPQNEPSFF